MNTHATPLQLVLEPNDARRLASLCGNLDNHIKQIEDRFEVEIHHRGNQFSLSGKRGATNSASTVIEQLYAETASHDIAPDDVHLMIQEVGMQNSSMNDDTLDKQTEEDHSDVGKKIDDAQAQASIIKTKKSTIRPRGGNQQKYVNLIRSHDINFGVGPAGTGKTYLAVACAVEALIEDRAERILLVRPAVEAGEKLGFLPGDLSQKVDPYLRPLYDALYEMLGFETVSKLIEKNIIEIAPLAYMRGRTLNGSFVILDESQNTTREQMKMFLTRIGFGSTAVITGDPSQIDLPRGQASGLKHAIEVLKRVEGISFTYFQAEDVVRHPLVQRIVKAYDIAESQQASQQ